MLCRYTVARIWAAAAFHPTGKRLSHSIPQAKDRSCVDPSNSSVKPAGDDFVTHHDLLRENAELRSQIADLTKVLHDLVDMLQKEHISTRPVIRREGVHGSGAQSREAFRPSLALAEKQPAHVSEMDHKSLAELALEGNHSSHRERLLREIMCVDGVSWEVAHDKLAELGKVRETYYWLDSLPYRIGIALAFCGGIGGAVMVFYKPVALYYAINVVGEELPDEVNDISELTTNQVGTWTWNWMEPMIGTAMFLILCCQFTRSQALSMNMPSYNANILSWRANRVAARFPQYNRSTVRAWARHMPPVKTTFFPVYERSTGFKGPSSGL